MGSDYGPEPVRRKSVSNFKPSNHRRRVSSSFENPLYSLTDASVTSSTSSSSTSFTNASNGDMNTTESLRFALNSAQFRYIMMEKSVKVKQLELETENRRLIRENLLLRHKVKHGHDQVDHLNQEKEALIREVECTSERWFNSTCGLLNSTPQSPNFQPLLRSRSQSLSRSSDLSPLFSSPMMSRSISLQEHRPRSVSCSHPTKSIPPLPSPPEWDRQGDYISLLYFNHGTFWFYAQGNGSLCHLSHLQKTACVLVASQLVVFCWW